MVTPKVQLKFLLYFVVAFIVVGSTVSLWFLTDQPWYGLTLEYNAQTEEQYGIRVMGVDPTGPSASEIYVGDIIDGVVDGGKLLKIPVQLRVDPNLLPDYEFYNRFYSQIELLAEAARSNTVTFLVNGEKTVTVTAENTRPLASLDWMLWYYFLASPLCLLTGLLCYIKRTDSLVTGLLFFLGVSTCVFTISEIFLDREVFATPRHIFFASQMRYLTGTFYPFATIGVFFRWPVPILSRRLLLLFFLLSCAIFINSFYQFVALPMHDRMGHIIVLYILLILLFIVQWRKSKGNPVNRASLSLMLLSIVIPVSISVIGANIPMAMNTAPLLDARILLGLNAPAIMLGWALAVFRYRLFDVERWWFKSLLWIIGGILVVFIDLIFVLILHYTVLQALPLALLFAGFVYFPLRQWLLSSPVGVRKIDLQSILTDYMRDVSPQREPAQYIGRFEDLLKNYLNPAQIDLKDSTRSGVGVLESGLKLELPLLNSTQSLVLSGKNNAVSLFNNNDKAVLSSLIRIGGLSHSAVQIRESAIFEERSRIMRDLHDTLGAKLLTLMHRCDNPADENSAREALQILRETVRYSMKRSSTSLAEVLAELRVETHERLEQVSGELKWCIDLDTTDLELEAVIILALKNLVREGVSNALKHGVDNSISISIEASVLRITIIIRNEVLMTPNGGFQGSGLNGLQSRVRKLNGSLDTEIEPIENGSDVFCLKAVLPTST